MTGVIPKDEWVWYGYPGHFVAGSECAYHLSTRIGKYLISTVGDYRPYGEREPLSSDPDSFFETMVFHCDGETEDGDPNVTEFIDIECVRYKEAIDAERGHRAMCEKYAKGGGHGDGNI